MESPLSNCYLQDGEGILFILLTNTGCNQSYSVGLYLDFHRVFENCGIYSCVRLEPHRSSWIPCQDSLCFSRFLVNVGGEHSEEFPGLLNPEFQCRPCPVC